MQYPKKPAFARPNNTMSLSTFNAAKSLFDDWTERASARIAKRRKLSPIRDARRQHQLTRQRTRVDHVPQYVDKRNGRGEIVSSTYIGHKIVQQGAFPQGVFHA